MREPSAKTGTPRLFQMLSQLEGLANDSHWMIATTEHLRSLAPFIKGVMRCLHGLLHG